MNELDSLKLGFQSLASDVQMLSQTVKTATSNMTNAGQQVMGQAQNVSARAQNFAVQAMPQSLYGPAPAFVGQPMGVPYGAMAPLNTGRGQNIISNLYNGTFNNEYNRPANWFRDILAGAGKEFVDTSSEEAKKYAARNWGYRAQMGKWDAMSTAAYFIPGVGIPAGLAMDYIAKPLLAEGDKRRYEYWNFLDRTGARNVDARLGANPRGGFTDEQKKILSSEVQGAWKGTGFKKSQWDELVQLSEQAGYFKTIDKASVDSFKSKFDQLAKDAKYAMQTLHTTTAETAKIMGDINKMSGSKPGSTIQINQLNTAAAYAGLSPMQMHEFAQGRSGMYTSMGSTETGGYASALRELTNIIGRTPPGTTPNPENVLGLKDASYEEAKNNNALNYALVSAMGKDKKGNAIITQEGIEKFFSQRKTNAQLIEDARTNVNNLTTAQLAMVSRGEGYTILERDFKGPKENLRTALAGKQWASILSTADPTWDPTKPLSDDNIVTLATHYRKTPKEINDAIVSGDIMSLDLGDRYPMPEKRNISSYTKMGKAGYIGSTLDVLSRADNPEYYRDKASWKQARGGHRGDDARKAAIDLINNDDSNYKLKGKRLEKLEEETAAALAAYSKGDESLIRSVFNKHAQQVFGYSPHRSIAEARYVADAAYRAGINVKEAPLQKIARSERQATDMAYQTMYKRAGASNISDASKQELDLETSRAISSNIDWHSRNSTSNLKEWNKQWEANIKRFRIVGENIGITGSELSAFTYNMAKQTTVQRDEATGKLHLLGQDVNSSEYLFKGSSEILNNLSGAVNDLYSGAGTQAEVNELSVKVLREMLTKIEALNMKN